MASISDQASEYLTKIQVLKSGVIYKFFNRKALKPLPREELFKNILVSSSLRTIVLTFYDLGLKNLFYLQNDLPGFGHSIVCYFDTIFLIAGCNHLGEALNTVFIAKFCKSSQNKLQNDFCRRSEAFSLKVKRKFCTSLLYKQKIFVFGGRNLEARDSFEVIDLELPGRENQVRSMKCREGYVNSCLFQNYGFVVSSDSNSVDVFDLETFELFNSFTIENFSGLVFVHVTENFKYFITVQKKIIVFDQNWEYFSFVDYFYRISWMQTYVVNEEMIIFNETSTNQSRSIHLIQGNL